jgi:hypothetical protein
MAVTENFRFLDFSHVNIMDRNTPRSYDDVFEGVVTCNSCSLRLSLSIILSS